MIHIEYPFDYSAASSTLAARNLVCRLHVPDQPLESAYLRQTHRTKLFLPAIKCLLRHTQPATDLRDRLAVDSWAKAYVICSSEKRFFFMHSSNGFGGASVPKNSHFKWT